MTIVIADEHVLLLEGVTAILTRAGHRVLAAVSDLASLEQHVRALTPDVCVIESKFNEGDAIGVIPHITMSSPETRTVVLTADPASTTLHRALEAGAAGYVHKTRGTDVLLDVLDRVALGQIVIEGSFIRPLVQANQPAAHMQRMADYLTPREKECLTLITAGLDTSAMAGNLGVSATTIRTHVQAILTKLGVHSRLEAAALAIRYGLVDQPDRATG